MDWSHEGMGHSIWNQDRRLSPNLAVLFPTPSSHWLRDTPTPTDQMRRRHWLQTEERRILLETPLTLQLF
jgi:hypothetical protein